MEAVAVAFSMASQEDAVQDGLDEEGARALLAGFRSELYRCLARRRDALFEARDAVLCRPGRVHMLAKLSLEPECRRGHGALYDAVNAGRVQVARLRRALAGRPLPAWDDGRIRLAVDVSNWLRPLEPGHTSWTLPLDAVLFRSKTEFGWLPAGFPRVRRRVRIR